MNQEVWESEVFGGHSAYQDAVWHGWGETERPDVKNTEVVMCSLKQAKTKQNEQYTITWWSGRQAQEPDFLGLQPSSATYLRVV